jgi:hypothetical protein
VRSNLPVFCLITFALGAFLATCIPVVQFAFGLTVVTAAGLGVALWVGVRLVEALLWGAIMFACAQIAYVCGVALIAMIGDRLPRRDEGQKRTSAARAALNKLSFRVRSRHY